MNVLLEQMKYDGWANGRVLDVISHLAPEAFARMLPGSFPSIQQTLVHILWAEELWLERWQGRPFKSALDAGSYPTVESVRAGLEDVHARQIEFLCGDAALPDRIVGYMNFKGERWEYSIRQMVQHLHDTLRIPPGPIGDPVAPAGGSCTQHGLSGVC